METGLESLSDREVEAALGEAVDDERLSTARVLRCLIEFERRHLHESKPYPSLFHYCTGALGYCEQAAYKRMQAAKAASAYPIILELLERRRIDLSRIVAVRPHLTPENHGELLARAGRMKMRELEFFVAGLAPQPIKRDSIRASVSPPVCSAAPAPEPLDLQSGPLEEPATPVGAPIARIEPVTADLARVAFNADRRTVEDLERACELLGCTRTNLTPVMARAIEALLREIDPDRRLEAKRCRKPRVSDPKTRRIPQHVRDAVRKRDGGQCTFIDERGQRCSARHRLEFDHIRPFAAGGNSDDPANIRLRCKLHNLLEARRWFGRTRIERAVAAKRLVRARPGNRGPP